MHTAWPSKCIKKEGFDLSLFFFFKDYCGILWAEWFCEADWNFTGLSEGSLCGLGKYGGGLEWIVAVEIVTCAIYLENFVNLWVRLSLWETPVGYPWEGCLEVLLFRGPFGQGLRAAVQHGGGRGTVCAYEQGAGRK